MRVPVLASVVLATAAAAPLAGPAEASTLVYRYTGEPLVADAAANLGYLRLLLAEGYDVDDGVLRAIAQPTQPAAEFEVIIDEARLPGGSVRAQTVSLGQFGPNAQLGEVGRPYGIPSFATESLDLTFDETGRIVDWDYFVYWEPELFDSDPAGDEYSADPTGDLTSSPDVWPRWTSPEPGEWALVEGAPAPIPAPAALPLALAGLGLLGLLARRRRAVA